MTSGRTEPGIVPPAVRAIPSVLVAALSLVARPAVGAETTGGRPQADTEAPGPPGDPIRANVLSGPGEPADALPGTSPGTPAETPLEPPARARGDSAPPQDAPRDDPGVPATTPRVAGDELAGPRDQLLATLPVPAFVPIDPPIALPFATAAPPIAGPGPGTPPDLPGWFLPPGPDPTPPPPDPTPPGPPGWFLPPGPDPTPPLDPPPSPAPPNVVQGTSSGGSIAFTTIAPDWLIQAVSGNPGVIQVARLTSPAPAGAQPNDAVSLGWADLDGDGSHDGHLFRVDNDTGFTVTFFFQEVRSSFPSLVGLPGTAAVPANTSAEIWIPLTSPVTLRFNGSGVGGPRVFQEAAASWSSTDLGSPTTQRIATAGETLFATAAPDVFVFAPGGGVDRIVGYDPADDAIELPTGTVTQIVALQEGTVALLVGAGGAEGIMFDGIAWTPSLTLSDLGVTFV